MTRPFSRREFIAAGSLAGAAAFAGLAAGQESRRSAANPYRACVIGHTGGGGYGHGMDLAFHGLPEVAIQAVADPDEKGRQGASRLTGAPRSYADWREMLERERPDLVAIGPRGVRHRLEMASAAAQIGAHVYIEKPMAASLEEADAIVLAAEKHKTQVAVAHLTRLIPSVLHLKKVVDEGLIGTLLEIRTRGKEDHRAGGEDLAVHGTHCFYLMRYLAGEPIWCNARVTEKGRDVTAEDRREGTEPVGLVAGDWVQATFGFAGGIQGFFASQKAAQGARPRYQLSLHGSEGVLLFHIGFDPVIHHLPDPLWSPGKSGVQWRPLPDVPGNDLGSDLKGYRAANRRVVNELLSSIESGTPSAVGGREGRAVVEMISSVYASHLEGRRIPFPLKNRRHPLEGDR